MILSTGKLRLVAALLVVALVGAGCASLGLGRQGNKFNYDNVTKLQKGMTKQQVETLMEGKPRATGRQTSTGYEHWHYEYTQTAGSGIGRWLPVGGASASTGQAYACDVYFNSAGKLAQFDYHTTELGSQSVGF
jgi:outer membrane protein assembly factor BamE (lipoprotein component of BamABCDE complex)